MPRIAKFSQKSNVSLILEKCFVYQWDGWQMSKVHCSYATCKSPFAVQSSTLIKSQRRLLIWSNSQKLWACGFQRITRKFHHTTCTIERILQEYSGRWKIFITIIVKKPSGLAASIRAKIFGVKWNFDLEIQAIWNSQFPIEFPSLTSSNNVSTP